MKHALKPSQYAILAAVMLTASVGDTLLSHGMSQIGPVDLHHLHLLFHALGNIYIISGIVLLIGSRHLPREMALMLARLKARPQAVERINPSAKSA
jgi:hypothetical protein